MARLLRRTMWFAPVALALGGLMLGTALAHEDQEVAEYTLNVGWIEEPAYEGFRNGVEVRVTQTVQQVTEASGHHDEGASADHHDEGTSADHHEGTSADRHQEGASADHHHEGASADHHHGNGGMSVDGSMAMDGSGHGHGPVEGGEAMSVSFTAEPDPYDGVNVQIMTEGFQFASRNVNLDHVPGEGHAHIYVDDVKIGRVYTPFYHLVGVEPGMHTIRVTLNANTHDEYLRNGEAVDSRGHIMVPEPAAHAPGHGMQMEAEQQIGVSLSLEPDALSGANLFVEFDGITMSGENASKEHVAGQGHAHMYVNGAKVSRLYGNSYHLDKMQAGANEVRVTLNANSHEDYTWQGQPVEAAAMVHIDEDKGGAGYGEAMEAISSDHHSMEAMEDLAENVSISGDAAMSADSTMQVPVEGLEESLQVEVIHVATDQSRVLDLRADIDVPGRYFADLIPTAPGVYRFRVFGSIGETAIDQSFVSAGGGGGFDDVQSASDLQFPEKVAGARELESAVRGAMATAQEAQDAALTTSASSKGSSGNALSIVALVVGALGLVAGIGGVAFALRKR